MICNCENRKAKLKADDFGLSIGRCVALKRSINNIVIKSQVLMYNGISRGRFKFQVEKDKDDYIYIKADHFPIRRKMILGNNYTNTEIIVL